MKNLILFFATLATLAAPITAHAAVSESDKALIAAPRNFITNGGFEAGKAGVSAFADAAASTPVDLTGGSPNSTATASTSSPLSGSSSLVWTKSGSASRQGEGFSIPFTTDAASSGKVITCSFDYAVTSGTYADDEMRVWVYDVSASALIQPAGYLIKNAQANLSVPQGPITFQPPTTSSSFRIGVYTAGTSTSNYTLKFDNFFCGVKPPTSGAVVTDQAENSNWSTNGFGTLVVKKFFQRRSGDTLFVRGIITAGTTAASTASISLPSGMALDSAKLPAFVTRLGTGEQIVSGAGGTLSTSNRFVLFYDGSDTSKIYITYAGGSSVYTKQNGSTLLGSGDSMSFEFAIPVSGYSSGVITSDQSADSRVVSFGAYRASSSQTASAGTPLEIVPNTSRFDTTSSYSTSTGRFTAPASGYYEFNGGVYYTIGGTAPSSFATYFLKNGTGDAISNSTSDAFITSKNYSNRMSAVIYLNAGDYVSMWASAVGQAVTIQNSGSTNDVTFFYGKKIQGPNQVAATETVAARYTSTSTASIPSAGLVLNFDTKDFDTHGAVTTGAAWKFTAPVAGKYRVTAGFETSNTAAASAIGQWFGIVNKNGASYQQVIYINAGTTISYRKFGRGSTVLNLVAGDTISFSVYSTAGENNTHTIAPFSTDSATSIEIERVGN